MEEHLSTGGPSVKSVFGAHSEAAFKSELASINGTIVGTPTELAPGIEAYTYTVNGKNFTKTTYDSRYTDAQILSLSQRASSQVWTEIQNTGVVPIAPKFVTIDGIPFKVNISNSGGSITLYAHPGVK